MTSKSVLFSGLTGSPVLRGLQTGAINAASDEVIKDLQAAAEASDSMVTETLNPRNMELLRNFLKTRGDIKL